jgi:hypothetical protein
LQCAEVEGGVVLAKQPDRHAVALFGELPERVALLEPVGIGADYLVGVEELLLQLVVVRESPLFERVTRDDREVELGGSTDSDRRSVSNSRLGAFLPLFKST